MPAGLAKYPVVNVSYNDAIAYCNWLSEKVKSASYRLPTEKIFSITYIRNVFYGILHDSGFC